MSDMIDPNGPPVARSKPVPCGVLVLAAGTVLTFFAGCASRTAGGLMPPYPRTTQPATREVNVNTPPDQAKPATEPGK